MRSFLSLLVCGCAAAPYAPTPRGALPCEVLPILGAADPRALAGDAQGGLALVGGFRGTVRAAQASLDGAGIFVLRTEPDGAVRWLRAVGDASSRANAVAFAADGSVVVAGEAGGRCFAARLAAADGKEVWLSAVAAETSSCRALAAGASGMWMAGSFSGVFDADTASKGLTDVFVAQLTDAGGIRVARVFGGKGRDLPRAIAVAPSGEVLVAGQFGGEVDPSIADVDFGRGPVRTAGDFDGFLLALAPDGRTRWVTTFGDSGDDEIAALAVGPDGAIYGAGHHQPDAYYRGLVPHDVGNYTASVARYSAAGRGEWVRIFEGQNSSATSLAFDARGRLWAAGDFLGDLRVGSLSSRSAGKQDAFAVAFAPGSGELLGSRTWGGAEEEHLVGIARIPGGLAAAGHTRGELPVCGKEIGSPGEQTGFVIWLRNLAQ